MSPVLATVAALAAAKGEKGVAGGRSLGLHEVPGGSARGGQEHVLEILDVETSMGAANFDLEA